jgi:prevent-host-death family protein
MVVGLVKGEIFMPQIRPISDLRNNFTDISRQVHDSNEPLFLTRNGYGDMVVMSVEAYEKGLFQSEVYQKLMESALESEGEPKLFGHDEVFGKLRADLAKRLEAAPNEEI